MKIHTHRVNANTVHNVYVQDPKTPHETYLLNVVPTGWMYIKETDTLLMMADMEYRVLRTTWYFKPYWLTKNKPVTIPLEKIMFETVTPYINMCTEAK